MQNALARAIKNNQEISNKKKDHSLRSKDWIECLAEEFRKELSSSEFRVFSAGHSGNRKEFKLNEFLFDISVVKIKTIPSASGKKNLTYVAGMEWAIESEFQKSDSRASIIDFSKLIISSANKKLLILPDSHNLKKWALSTLCNAIEDTQGNYFLAFVPHPADWNQKSKIELYEYKVKEWQLK